jgi:predicted RNA binding protein YcfA (HicA-like mRNA interferase family)
MTSEELIKFLKSHGFAEIARKGTHSLFKNPNHEQRIALPILSNKRNLSVGMVRAIAKILDEAGIANKEELESML